MYGRPMGLAEMRRIMRAERVERTYTGMMSSDMAKWSIEHPKDFEFITVAAKLYESQKKRDRPNQRRSNRPSR